MVGRGGIAYFLNCLKDVLTHPVAGCESPICIYIPLQDHPTMNRLFMAPLSFQDAQDASVPVPDSTATDTLMADTTRTNVVEKIGETGQLIASGEWDQIWERFTDGLLRSVMGFFPN